MLLGMLGVSLLGNLLTGKGIYRAGKSKGEGIARVFYGRPSSSALRNNKNGFLLPPHSLTNFEIQKYSQNEPRLNGVYSRYNLPKIKYGAYKINLHEYSDIETH